MDENEQEIIAQLIHDELIRWRAEQAEKFHRHPETVFLSLTDHVTALESRLAKVVCVYFEGKQ